MELPIYRSAVRQFGQRVDLVRDHQWDLSTPDPRGTVADLVDRMTDLQTAVASSVMSGRGDVEAATAPGSSVAGSRAGHRGEPAGEPEVSTGGRPAAWSTAAGAAVAAFGTVGDWSVTLDSPYGVVTVEELLWRTATELSIHTWDVARAIGAPDELPNDLLAHVLDRAREHGDRWFDAEGYAPPIPVPGCTEDLIELLARAGRNRWWRRTG